MAEGLPRRSAARLTAVEWAEVVVWMLWWLAAVWWVVALWRTMPGLRLSRELLVAGFTLGIAAPLLLVTGGYLLARTNRWLHLVALTGFVTALVLALYGVAMLLPTESGDDNTHAAAAGGVIFALPIWMVVTAFCAVGAGTQRVVRALTSRRAMA